jgi:uncharacterized protein (TIGR00730 family)
MQSVCVFLSSISGHDPAYAETVRALGAEIARRGLRLVYGGAQVGLMGKLAEAAMAHGGQVVGIIPETLVQREVAHHGLTELHVVQTMHQRKALMAELSDGFLVAPGGFGTLEETFEILTAKQLELHGKPVVHVDVRGFWAPMVAFLDRAVAEGILRPAVREHFVVAPDATSALELLLRLAAHAPAGSAFSAETVANAATSGARLGKGSTVVPVIADVSDLADLADSSVEALDLGAQGAQAGVDALVAAVDLADVVDGAGPVGGQRR